MTKENKKYYWLKLKNDFFDDDTISYLEEQENGKDYVIFFLKLCLKSLKDDGKLIRVVGKTLIPYDVNSLAKLTNTSVDTVRVAMSVFKELGLIEVLESGEIYISQIQEMIGSETSKAELMRRKRAKDRLDGNNVTLIGNNVTEVLPNCYTEIELEKEIELEIDKDNNASEDAHASKPKKHKFGEYNHVLLTEEEYQKLQNEFGNANELVKFLDEYIEMKGYKAKSHYLAIRKWVVDAVKEQNRKKAFTNKQNQQRVAPVYNQNQQVSKSREELLRELSEQLGG